MSIKPILFNGEMVRAILDGRKTQTRLIAFENKDLKEFHSSMYMYPSAWWYKGRVFRTFDDFIRNVQTPKPKYKSGNILWVRETYCEPYAPGMYAYRADYDEHDIIPNSVGHVSLSANMFRWKPSIHMPKQAARIFLRVNNVRLERLQEITPEQARAEGCDGRCDCPSSGSEGSISCVERDFSVEKFESVWDSTIKRSDLPLYGWNANPWVWVIEFERIERPPVFF